MHSSQIPQGTRHPRDYEQTAQLNEGQWWREKCEEQRQQFEAIHFQDKAELESACNQIVLLERENVNMKGSCDQLLAECQKRGV